MFEVRKRSRLPHWHSDEAPYFVTFNLVETMPAEFRERLKIERRVRIAELERLKQRATASEVHAIDRMMRERAEEYLDSGVGECWLKRTSIAELVVNALMHFDDQRYRLLAWCVMPNHVHVVFNTDNRIDRVLNSWKSFTSKEANRLLGRAGSFWQQDYFDRTIRNRSDFDRTVRYVLENPVRSGLIDWP